ncbi:MAG TPA: hypothetical protein VKR55_12885 [Bradyrhizobium sp.]|uniref:hypothetical protein n=1 Tax=Bradyrhizobium sp. TaxID=376 RepID=UPI002CFD81A8|nr:hypothetical protein [Bradyrhizobium sp.]HLZ03034.1 hypothetical protein [Bradyrhizobium sp.]
MERRHDPHKQPVKVVADGRLAVGDKGTLPLDGTPITGCGTSKASVMTGTRC